MPGRDTFNPGLALVYTSSTASLAAPRVLLSRWTCPSPESWPSLIIAAMRRLLFFFASLLLVSACSGESNPAGPDGPVAFADVYQSSFSGIQTRRGEIISRESRWVEVWDELQSHVSPKPAIPAVNFNDRLLILGALGTNGDRCTKAQVQSVQTQGGTLVIRIAEVHRPSTCAPCPPDTSQAVHVVSVPRAATGATFTFVTATANSCAVP